MDGSGLSVFDDVPDLIDLLPEDFENREIDICLDVPHAWSIIAGYEYIESGKTQGIQGDNLRWASLQYSEIPDPCDSLDSYVKALLDQGKRIRWIHLGDEKTPYSHDGFPFLPDDEKKEKLL